MKKLFCVFLAALMALSMAACASSDEGGTDGSTTSTEPTRPSLEQFGPWVLTAEYENASNKYREYSYDENGNLLGFGSHRATSTDNDQGGKTLKLVPYDEDGKVSNYLSKYEYIYDAEGKLVHYRRLEALGDKLADSYTFTYNEDGKVVKQEKFYMDILQETMEFTYDGDRLTKSGFKSTVYDASFTYTYDDGGVLSKLDYSTKYVKTGNVDEGSLTLKKTVFVDDSVYRVTLSVAEESENIAAGSELVVYEELLDTAGGVDAVRLEFADWGFFHIASVPMRQLGTMNAANWSSGSATLIYKPLSVYLAEEAGK